jgi:DNA-directed RNA polymerase I subunit RPA1
VEQKGKITKEFLIPGELHDAKDKDPSAEEEEIKKDISELVLYVRGNELIKGMIDKAQFGKYGIVHTVHEFYGADTAGILLSTFSRLFTLFLQVN